MNPLSVGQPVARSGGEERIQTASNTVRLDYLLPSADLLRFMAPSTFPLLFIPSA